MKNTTDKTKSILEDYLKTIAVLELRNGKATVTALSRMIGVKKPSVYRSLKRLADDGLLIHERYGDISLTPQGKKIADGLFNRYNVLFKFFTDILKVDSATAIDDVCRIEHILSKRSIDKIEELVRESIICCPSGKESEDSLKND
jgi:Mn-dependent DtxR family transcriptional regulator